MTRVQVSVLTSAHDVADARLHREVAALVREGLSVEVLGLGDRVGGPPDARVRTWARSGLLRRSWRALVLPWLAGGNVLLTLDPDAAVGAALRVRLSRLHLGRRVRHVADVHEDYSLLLVDRGWARGLLGGAARVVVRFAGRAVAGADLLVVADEHLNPSEARFVLRNLPEPSMLPAVSRPETGPRALYVGDIRRSRGLASMLEVVRRAPRWTFDLVGPVSPADRPDLDRILAAEPDLAARVRLHGRRPPSEAWAFAQGAWAGLLLLEDTPAFREAMPSKLYEYLACGLPVVTTPLPRPAGLIAETGAGAVVEGPVEAAATLERWVDEPDTFASVREAAVAAASRWNGAQELDSFARQVAALVGDRK